MSMNPTQCRPPDARSRPAASIATVSVSRKRLLLTFVVRLRSHPTLESMSSFCTLATGPSYVFWACTINATSEMTMTPPKITTAQFIVTGVGSIPTGPAAAHARQYSHKIHQRLVLNVQKLQKNAHIEYTMAITLMKGPYFPSPPPVSL